MKKNNDCNEEFESRREFFKKMAKGVLPFLAVSVLGTSLFTSCDPDDPDTKKKDDNSTSCKGCSGSCDGSCSGSCDQNCSAACAFNCGTSSYYS